MVAPTIKDGGSAVIAGGRRVNRRRPSKKNSLAAKKARDVARKQKENSTLQVDPTQFADFKEKLAAGDLDDKLMSLMKEHNEAQQKKNKEEDKTPLTIEEIDRQLKQQKAKFNNDANKIENAVAKATSTEQPKTSARPEEVEVPKEKDVPIHVASALQNGSEHQGLRYDPTHYAEEDEEEEMLKALNSRDHIRYNMGI